MRMSSYWLQKGIFRLNYEPKIWYNDTKQINTKTKKNVMFRILLKSLSYLASATMVLLASGFLTLRPVMHYPNVPTANASGLIANCSDIVQLPNYPATPTIQNSDAGQFNFDSPGAAWQACGEENPRNRTFNYGNGQVDPSTVNAETYYLKGWLWNTNFGDVSTTCEGGFNTNSACGASNYGAYLVPDVNDTARIMGFSWNDQMGWIKMGCQGGTNTGVACGAINYGASVALRDGINGGTCPNIKRGDIFGYVYNDMVGYINMCGTHIDISDFVDFPNPYDSAISATISVDPNGPNNPVGHVTNDYETVYSNKIVGGGDFYQLTLSVIENGVAITNATPDRQIVISPPNITNTVKANQVTPCRAPNDIANAALPVCSYNAATISAFAQTATGFVATASSIAPTDADNQLSLNSVTLQVLNGAGEVLTTKNVVPQNGNFSFAPPIEVTHIAGKDGVGRTLTDESFQLTPDQSTAIAVKTAEKTSHSIAFIYTQLYSCTDSFDFIFDIANPQGGIFDATGLVQNDLPIQPAESANPINRFKAGVCSVAGRIIDVQTNPLGYFFAAPNHEGEATFQVYAKPTAVPAASADAVNNMAIQTVVSEASGAMYYSRSLQDGGAGSQAAKVEGNINISAVEKGSLAAQYQNWISDAVGNMILSNREPYLRAVRAALGGKNPSEFGDATLSGGGSIVGGEMKLLRTADLNSGGVLYYKHNAANGQNPCAIIIDENYNNAALPVTANKPTTLVTEGCNIFIDRDVVAVKTPQPNGQNPLVVGNLGIIALADYKLSGAMPGGKGGNVYVCNWATDVEANIVAEGSLYGFATALGNCGGIFLDVRRNMLNADGSPKQSSMQHSLLNRQLTIYGSLVSNNTYGGSKKAAPNGPLLGDGRIAVTPAEKTLSEAQDLNNIRFGKTVDGPDGAWKCWADNFVLSKLITDPPNATPAQICAGADGADNPNTPDYAGTFNLKYRQPLATQPIFNAL